MSRVPRAAAGGRARFYRSNRAHAGDRGPSASSLTRAQSNKLRIGPNQTFPFLTSEFFRPDHGHEQIDKQQERDHADDNGFHLCSYNFSQSSVYSAPTTKNAVTT